MSDIERPYIERRPSGPPSSCPVCGAATTYIGIAGVLTCRSAAGDHFEWRPNEPAAVHVESERADGDGNPPRTLDPGADNQRSVKSSASRHHEAQVETPPTEPFDTAVRFVREVKRQLDDAAAIEGEILGVDYRTAVVSRLSRDGARFAAQHYPLAMRRGVNCAGCTSAAVTTNHIIAWPCQTAGLALEMMRLTASDIAISTND